ncbi:MAG: aspartate--tRNA ligase [Syntrophaceae bacterium]|nr:aspartate--tRNA ligase [Syntrophaceae bacterium]
MIFKDRLECGRLGIPDCGNEVLVAGWVDALRDHGDLLFIHLRDRSGIVQAVFNPQSASPSLFKEASLLRNEFCIALRGRVQKREEGTENPNLDTGLIEIMATELAILGKSEVLPFPVSEKAMIAGAVVKDNDSVTEELRLKYRYLDLRRPTMQEYLFKRHRIVKTVRDFLDEKGFIEIETPMLTKSTPEGARDYLVPSRVHQGRFYALPQSPQLFKQLLMIGGYEKYFQVVRCFRDEDLRPNRQPEFTQLDLEASFIDEEFIYELMEELIVRIFAVGNVTLPRPFPRMTYAEAMDTMGSDRPDTRFGLRFVEATDIFQNTSYGIFKQIIERGGCIKGINIKDSSEKISKNVLQNEYAKDIVPSFGAKGMTWMRVIDGGLESNIVQFFSDDEKLAIIRRFNAQNGDVIIMIADASYEPVVSVLGQLRLHIANRLDMISEGTFSPLWVTDFPLFIATEDGVTSSHHPFTAPERTDFDPENRDEILSLNSRAYDVVVNGEELGGGSIRINDRDVQNKIFQALGLTDADVEEKFGFFLRALAFGAPPHGGIALGIDRVCSMILSAPSIREVIAFPKNRSAYCPLTEAPSVVTQDQLQELGLLDLKSDEKIKTANNEQDLIGFLSWVARIGVDDSERSSISNALDEAVRLAHVMNSKMIDHEPLFTTVNILNRTRPKGESAVSVHAKKDAIFKNAPSKKGNYFKVAAVLES